MRTQGKGRKRGPEFKSTGLPNPSLLVLMVSGPRQPCRKLSYPGGHGLCSYPGPASTAQGLGVVDPPPNIRDAAGAGTSEMEHIGQSGHFPILRLGQFLSLMEQVTKSKSGNMRNRSCGRKKAETDTQRDTEQGRDEWTGPLQSRQG